MHRITLLSFVSVLFVLFTTNGMMSQNQTKIKWGKIDKDHLTMTTYDKDPDASAVILSRVGHFEIGPTGNTYDYHIRIKILKEDAFDRANIELPFFKSYSKINGIKAQTINLDASGKEVVTPVDKKDIVLEKKSDDLHARKFSFPQVKVGSVIEYKYVFSFTNNSIHIKDWYFQSDIPCIYSEYNGDILEGLSYVFLINRSHPIEQIESPLGDKVNYAWVSRDIPALPEEPFITNMNDYYAKIRFQLKSYRQNGMPIVVLTSWENLNDKLWAMEGFGQALTWGAGQLDAVVRDLTNGVEDDEEKLKNIYDYVVKDIEWNGIYSWIVDTKLSTVNAEKMGNSSEVNFLLISMLKKAGLDAHPVMVSTRSHGPVYKAYPFYDQFNHSIAAVDLDGKRLLLDAIENLTPYHLLPYHNLNGEGFLVSKDQFEWVPLKTKKKYNHSCIGKFAVSADGGINGTLQVSDKDYAAVESREDYEYADSEKDYLAELFEDLSDVNIESSNFENVKDTYKPFNYTIGLSTTDYSSSVNEYLYVNPMLMEGKKENPFKMDIRTYPIDFAYPSSQNFILTLSIPDGYAVEELPENALVRFGEKEAEFKYTIAVKEKEIQLITKFKVNVPSIGVDQYEDLKQFYNLVIEKHAEQIVLKKM